MENVVAFNSELSSLYEQKPPISKAKMAAITKSAMRAIKFYKHVVQSVEKFILKCKPEYKVPGLYVIDSIVRQSRHQFGPDKDVFAPRFARNIKETFANLFRCAPEDKSRIIRVLNLWQKNNVFAPEVIQPIFDLADPNHPIYQLPPSGIGAGGANISGETATNGMNVSSSSMELSLNNLSGVGLSAGSNNVDDKHSGMPDLSNNNLQQLLNDPNVLRQLQTLQNFQKMKQQEQEQQYKINEMRMQEVEFEKHLQNVLKTQPPGHPAPAETNEFNKEVEFVSMEQKIEVINLDANDSRSPSPSHDRDRYKSSRRRSSRSRSRSRSRDRGRRRRTRSRSRSRSPRGSYRRRSSRDRDRDRNDRNSIRDKEREREHERERRKKGLPELKKEHLSVCSTTLWVGHLSKLVYQEELSDTFGAYGDIVSIDLIVPRGCAFIVMNRRQDAYKAMQGLKNHKLQGRVITISWAAGKGVKSKEWKDFWDLDLGVTYIPWTKLDNDTDFDVLEEGGMFDEDSMPGWVKDKINHLKSLKEKAAEEAAKVIPEAPPLTGAGNSGILFGIDTTQPPPGPPPTGGPPPKMPLLPVQFPMAPPMGGPPRMLGPMGPMPLAGIPMPPNMVPGMPPPHPMMMPAGMMPPGFPPMPGPPMGAGNGPPPGMGPPMGMPPPGILSQYPPPASMGGAGAPTGPGAGVPPPSVGGAPTSSDDQMDIEMDEEDGPNTSANNSSTPTPVSAPAVNFSQPPPMFSAPGAPGVGPPGGGPGPSSEKSEEDIFSRDRGRERERERGGPNNSRWGGPSAGGGVEPVDLVEAARRWRENGGQANFNEGGPPNFSERPPNFNDRPPNFNEGPPKFNEGPPNFNDRPPNFNDGGMGGGPPNFNDGGRGGRGGPMNMQPPDMNNPSHRPEFMNDFDGRGGGPRGAGPRGANHNGDFYPNMQNRFNQPTSLMQMRIPPPNAFNQRMGGPGGGGGGPMFMRGGGHGGPGGGPGQGPGRQGFFNPRNPFDRDIPGGRGGGRGGRGARGGGRGGPGGMGGHGPPGNWSDEEGDDSNMFKRRPGGNRFRDRDIPDDRHGRSGGNRRGGSGGSRDRSERGSDYRDNERGGDRGRSGNRRSSRGDSRESDSNKKSTSGDLEDTEADWDMELEEYKPEVSPSKAKDANSNKTTKQNKSEEGDTENTTTKRFNSNTNTNTEQRKDASPVKSSEESTEVTQSKESKASAQPEQKEKEQSPTSEKPQTRPNEEATPMKSIPPPIIASAPAPTPDKAPAAAEPAKVTPEHPAPAPAPFKPTTNNESIEKPASKPAPAPEVSAESFSEPPPATTEAEKATE